MLYFLVPQVWIIFCEKVIGRNDLFKLLLCIQIIEKQVIQSLQSFSKSHFNNLFLCISSKCLQSITFTNRTAGCVCFFVINIGSDTKGSKCLKLSLPTVYEESWYEQLFLEQEFFSCKVPEDFYIDKSVIQFQVLQLKINPSNTEFNVQNSKNRGKFE